PDHSYLLTGGLGGLGRSVASWMLEKGAHNLIFLPCSAGKTDIDQQYFREIESMGCEVTAIAGKADNKSDIQQVIQKATKPIKGVFHLAMVLRNAPILGVTCEECTGAVKPKVDGAWNIHKAFQAAGIALDFFFVTSPLVTLIDQPGQGNYAATNTFLESFMQYRHRAGLPTSVLGVYPVDDISFHCRKSVNLQETEVARPVLLAREGTTRLHGAYHLKPPPTVSGIRPQEQPNG
ncbi:KR-domain-containing protein, partial [Zopfia rhizophila CBS 207.26]